MYDSYLYSRVQILTLFPTVNMSLFPGLRTQLHVSIIPVLRAFLGH